MHPHWSRFDIQFNICSCFTFCFLRGSDIQNTLHLGMWRVVDILHTLLSACFLAWFLAHPLKLGRTWEQTFVLCYIYILIGYFRPILIFKRCLPLKLKLKWWILLCFYFHLILQWLDTQELWSIRRFSTLWKTLDAFLFINTLSF